MFTDIERLLPAMLQRENNLGDRVLADRDGIGGRCVGQPDFAPPERIGDEAPDRAGPIENHFQFRESAEEGVVHRHHAPAGKNHFDFRP